MWLKQGHAPGTAGTWSCHLPCPSPRSLLSPRCCHPAVTLPMRHPTGAVGAAPAPSPAPPTFHPGCPSGRCLSLSLLAPEFPGRSNTNCPASAGLLSLGLLPPAAGDAGCQQPLCSLEIPCLPRAPSQPAVLRLLGASPAPSRGLCLPPTPSRDPRTPAMGTSPSGPPPLRRGGEVPQGAGCHGATLRAVGAQEPPSSCRGLCPGSASPGPAGVIQLRLCAFPPLTSPRGLARGFTARVCLQEPRVKPGLASAWRVLSRGC